MKTNRTELVYDIYSFLYREPQHIGKSARKDSKYNTHAKSMHKLQHMEVTLNHMANIFFSFMPETLLHEFFCGTCKQVLPYDEYDLWVRSLEVIVDDLGDFTQPDLFFVGQHNVISVEMKVGAKSSLEQLMKYAFLHEKTQQYATTKRNDVLIYLGQGSFSKLWKEGYESVSALKDAFATYAIPKVSKKGAIQLADYAPQIKQRVAEMTIASITYDDLKTFCLHCIQADPNNRQIHKLMQGMIDELAMRGLVGNE